MRKREFIAANIAQLDPVDCGSIISYSVRRGKYGICAEISLSDCNRMISWYFDRHSSGTHKIDTILEILTAFREDYTAATKMQRRKRRKK